MSTESYSPSDLVLVTGANGHVAQHVVDQLLKLPNGPRVRATVRSTGTAQGIEAFYKGSVPEGKLEVITIPDMLAEGAFDGAVKDVTHIAHIASPFVVNPKSVEEDLLKPAITGTTSILKSAAKVPSVKAVVITSSFAAVYDPAKHFRPGYIYTTDDWNPITYEEAASPDLDLTQWVPVWRQWITYLASKKLAEEAAWAFHASARPTYTLSTILPTYIAGPTMLPLSGVAGLSLSNDLVWRIASDGSTLPDVDFQYWVDVRDVARAHVNALVRKEAQGGRWLLSSFLANSDIADVVRRNFPQFTPSTEVQKVDFYKIDNRDSVQVLGLGEWTPLEKSIVDLIPQVVEAERKAKRD